MNPARVTSTSEISAKKIYSSTDENTLTIHAIDSQELIRVNLVDLAGRIVYSEETRPSAGKIHINTNDLPKNVYLLQISGINTLWKSKVIIR